jgi:hypothetical protein
MQTLVCNFAGAKRTEVRTPEQIRGLLKFFVVSNIVLSAKEWMGGMQTMSGTESKVS